MLAKIVGGVIIAMVLIGVLGRYIWILVAVIFLLWLIRLGADFYWSSQDR